MDGWETILSFPFGAGPIFRGELLVSGSVSIGYSLFVMINISPIYTSKIQFAAVDSADSVFFLGFIPQGPMWWREWLQARRFNDQTPRQDLTTRWHVLGKTGGPSRAKDALRQAIPVEIVEIETFCGDKQVTSLGFKSKPISKSP